MKAAVRAYIRQNPDIDPLDIHWVVPLALRRDEPAVRDMPGRESDVIIMVRAILSGWWLHGPGQGKLPPGPREARDPRVT
jgi:hypothetical protein